MAKKLTKVTPNRQPEKFCEISIQPKKPVVAITYLDDKEFNLNDLLKANRGSAKPIKEFQSFLIKVREYESISELVKNHSPHTGNYKNTNHEKSDNKVSELLKKYGLEIDCLIHLHALTNGNGKMVLYGFIVDNIFEIVWIDPNHELMKV